MNLAGWTGRDEGAKNETRAHLPIPEAAENPLMLQGDHGPVAFRHIHVRPLRELNVR